MSTNVGAGSLQPEYAISFRRAARAFWMLHVARAIYRLRCLKLQEQELLGLISAGRCWRSPPVRLLVAYALIEGDALDLPFRDGTFDVATIAFGLRNLSNVESGLAELSRVLKPGGWVAVLEFSRPANAMLRPLFNLYFRKLLPWMGGLVSGSRSAYTYLPASVQKFPDQSQLSLLMEQAGFVQVGYENLTGGIAALHMGRRPE